MIGSASVVLARGGFSPGGVPGWDSIDPTEYAEQFLAEQRANLGITSDQEAAWNAYAGAVREKAELMKSHRQAMAKSTITPEENWSVYQKGFAKTQELGRAHRDLYALLTPEQRAGATVTGSGRPCPGN
jgi:hypothetical protein